MQLRILAGFVALGLLLAVPIRAQELNFYAETLTYPHRNLNQPFPLCMQVGVFMQTDGTLDGEDWDQIDLHLTYTLQGGLTLRADPAVEISDFLGSSASGAPEPGLVGPFENGQRVENSNCGASDLVVNSAVTIQGSFTVDSPYLGNDANPSATGTEGTFVESVDTNTGSITLSRSHSAPLFQANSTFFPGQLVAILEFPVNRADVGGWIQISFDAGAGLNSISRSGPETIDATTTDGLIAIGPGCLNEDIAITDNVSGEVFNVAGITFGVFSYPVSYLDPQVGGPGADFVFRVLPPDFVNFIDLTIDSFTSGTLAALPEHAFSFTNPPDNIPPLNAGFTPSFGLMPYTQQIGTQPELQTQCNFFVDWDFSCEVSLDGPFVPGGNANVDVRMKSAAYDSANSRFGHLRLPNGMLLDLDTPSSINGAELFYEDVVSLSDLGTADQGNYQVTMRTPGGFDSICSLNLDFGIGCTRSDSCMEWELSDLDVSGNNVNMTWILTNNCAEPLVRADFRFVPGPATILSPLDGTILGGFGGEVFYQVHHVGGPHPGIAFEAMDQPIQNGQSATFRFTVANADLDGEEVLWNRASTETQTYGMDMRSSLCYPAALLNTGVRDLPDVPEGSDEGRSLLLLVLMLLGAGSLLRWHRPRGRIQR